ncbi:branched-subunit amino acid transport protein [Inhella inkyongensis]|uniref:Branched-subunit amino acid transport protein n=1 Tax=Inhella inkyongensis TaxID=392593 RepID=A0A840S9D9_9BURK|nr:AzlD domain-containing protein [Inhella inkyongensis]MBB5206232.1 branched-subunit amino acid transport protein [Inhella inkyongensis]
MNDTLVWLAIAGLTAVTVLTRGFFLISDKPWPLPAWAREALKFAPLAALVAVIAPEVLMTQGELITTWRDPRWPAVLVASLYYFWRRGILGTMVVGMAVLLTLRLGLGW